MAEKTNSITISENDLFDELSQLIEQSKQQVAVQANSAVTILFWQIGKLAIVSIKIFYKIYGQNTGNKLRQHCRHNWKISMVEILK